MGKGKGKAMGTSRFDAVLVLAVALLAAAPVRGGDEGRPNFQDDIAPMFEEYCIGCHRGSRARNGLKLDSLAGIKAGGSGGIALIPGDPDGSLLFQVVARTREPFMPWEDEPLPAELVTKLRDWISDGARETADSVVDLPADTGAPIALTPSADNRPAGAPAMPDGLMREPHWWSPRADAVVAMATSPWAPLAAIGGERQVTLYHTESLELLGVLVFEGSVKDLRFSRNGSLLLAAGGRAGASGRVVGWDVASGAQVFELGDEPDVVLAADLSGDQLLLALGGPDAIVRVYNVTTGETVYEREQHTDWITSVAFSPDGVLLATGDRNGGTFVWESLTGRTFHALPAHGGAVNGFAWRSDSRVLASAGDDGALRQHDMEDGRQLRQWSSHGGVLSLAAIGDGRIVSSGRDGQARVWDAEGKMTREIERQADLVTSAALTHDGGRVLVGGWDGRVRIYDTSDGTLVGELAVNPPPPSLRAWRAAVTRVETLARQTSELEMQLSASSVTLTEAENAMQQAGVASEAAASAANEIALRVEASREQADALQAIADRLHAALTERRTRVEERTGMLATAVAARDTAATELQAAVARLSDAESDATRRGEDSEGLTLARTLADGATARAQLTAARAAELEVELSRWRTELERWQTDAGPDLARAAEAADALSRVEAEATTARTTADAAAQTLATAQQARDTAQGTLANLRQQMTESQQALTQARTEAEAADAHWKARQAEIAVSGGRVE